jgi:hypothetical protein
MHQLLPATRFDPPLPLPVPAHVPAAHEGGSGSVRDCDRRGQRQGDPTTVAAEMPLEALDFLVLATALTLVHLFALEDIFDGPVLPSSGSAQSTPCNVEQAAEGGPTTSDPGTSACAVKTKTQAVEPNECYQSDTEASMQDGSEPQESES